MSTNLACSVVPSMEICPNCKSEVSITQVTPILLVNGFEDVEVQRTFKRRSGTWELVTRGVTLSMSLVSMSTCEQSAGSN